MNIRKIIKNTVNSSIIFKFIFILYYPTLKIFKNYNKIKLGKKTQIIAIQKESQNFKEIKKNRCHIKKEP